MDDTEIRIPPPEVNDLNRPYWEGLKAGALRFQRCSSCGHAWLPVRSECPHCLAMASGWENASGRAKLVSWVVYHTAYHAAYANRLPYIVAVVELAEGPRMISNIVSADATQLRIDMPLRLALQQESGVVVARFTPDADRP